MARSFDGANTKIAATIPQILGDKTIACWGTFNSAGESGGGRMVRVEIGGGTGYELFFNSVSRDLRVRTNFDTTNADSTSTQTLSTGTWYCLVAAYRNSDKKWRLYYGTQAAAMAEVSYAAQVAGSATEATGATGLVIGNRSDQTTTTDGSLERVGIWSAELTLAQAEMFRLGKIPLSNLSNFYPLTSPTAAQAEDIVGSATGTVTTSSVVEGPPIPLSFGNDGILRVMRANPVGLRGSWLGIYTRETVESGAPPPPPPPAPPPGLPNPDFGLDLRVWMQKTVGTGGDAPSGVLFLPDGMYYAGTLGDVRGSAYLHAFDASKPRNGWLILKAFNPGGVTVDLSSTAGGSLISDPTKGGGLVAGGDYDTALGVGTFRICFDDIFFQNGSLVWSGSQGVRFWYCPRTYPIGAATSPAAGSWKFQFDAACVARGVPVVSSIPDDRATSGPYWTTLGSAYMKGNALPTGLRLQNAGTIPAPGSGPACSKIQYVGGDIHDQGDDGVFLGSATSCKIVGTKIWHINNDASGYLGPGPAAWFHNDSIQWIGAESDIVVNDSMLGQHVELSAENPGSISATSFNRVWQCDSGGIGMSLSVNPGRDITGNIGGPGPNYYDWFCNGREASNTSPDFDRDFDNSTGYYPTSGSSGYTPTTITKTFVHLSNATLASMGISVDGATGLLVDVMQVVNHASNPANIWRAANPRETRDTYFAGTWD